MEQISTDYDPTAELMAAAEQVLWKLSHNYSASGKGYDSVPAPIDRRDATAKMLRKAVERYREYLDPSLSLCGQGMCDACYSRWCEDGQS